VTKSVSTAQAEALQPLLDAAQTASQITWSNVAVLDIKTKYEEAQINRIHMEADAADLASLIALTVLGGAASQAQANARANALQALMGTNHMLGVGTILVDGEHLAADTALATTLLAIPLAVDIGTCQTLTQGLNTAIIGHGNSSGVHFHDDTGVNGSGFTPTNATADTLAKQRVDLDQIRQAMLNHFSFASQ
jgi:hypothetical protein